MKKELEKKLFEKYPKIFSGINKPPTETLICFGIETGDGWYDLIDKLCNDIQTYLDEHPEVPQVEAVQIKEKFSGLRYYIDGGDDTIYDLIDKAEHQSYFICEECGLTSDVGCTDGWLKTICKTCYENSKPPISERNWKERNMP